MVFTDRVTVEVVMVAEDLSREVAETQYAQGKKRETFDNHSENIYTCHMSCHGRGILIMGKISAPYPCSIGCMDAMEGGRLRLFLPTNKWLVCSLELKS